VTVATLLDMTFYQPAAAPRISPAKLAIAGLVTVVLAIALIFGLGALLGATPAAVPVLMVSGLLGRALVIAGIVLIVLSVVRALDRR
jgi:hypothetical protein